MTTKRKATANAKNRERSNTADLTTLLNYNAEKHRRIAENIERLAADVGRGSPYLLEKVAAMMEWQGASLADFLRDNIDEPYESFDEFAYHFLVADQG
jgi:hypothetical protein